MGHNWQVHLHTAATVTHSSAAHGREDFPLATKPAELVLRHEVCKTMQKAMCFPTLGHTTIIRPDVVLWSTAAKKVLIIALAILWEEGIPESDQFKRLKKL